MFSISNVYFGFQNFLYVRITSQAKCTTLTNFFEVLCLILKAINGLSLYLIKYQLQKSLLFSVCQLFD